MSDEEIKDRVNKTKNAFHKLGIEGQVNINIMLNDIEFLLKEIEELKEKNNNLNWYFENQKDNFVHKDKIKAKIEELNKDFKEYENGQEWEIQDEIRGQIEVLQSLLEKE